MRTTRHCDLCQTTETPEVTPEAVAADYPCWFCCRPSKPNLTVYLITSPGPGDVPAVRRTA
jgi:hypothetical protein